MHVPCLPLGMIAGGERTDDDGDEVIDWKGIKSKIKKTGKVTREGQKEILDDHSEGNPKKKLHIEELGIKMVLVILCSIVDSICQQCRG